MSSSLRGGGVDVPSRPDVLNNVDSPHIN
jgi:hypothetical protein